MKMKNAAILLMIGSIYWILLRIYYIIDAFSAERWEITKDYPISFGFDSLAIILPFSLLVLAIALLQNNEIVKKSKEEETPIQNEVQNENQIISVGDWLVNFLITIIPFVGIIFIIIWANDDKNKARKNWAIASLIWSGIFFVLSLFIYTIIIASFLNRN